LLKPHVVIFGINAFPEVIGIAPYTSKLVSFLGDAGWDVELVTGLPHYPEWQVPASYQFPWRRSEWCGGVMTTRLRHAVPGRQTAARRGLYEATFFANGIARRPFTRTPDLFIGVVPSLSGGMLATAYGARYRRPSVIVVQDLMANAAAQSGMAGGCKAAGPTRMLEGATLRRADHVVVVSNAFRETIQNYRVPDERITELRNWSHFGEPTCDRACARAALGWNPGETIVLHAGNMGLKQGLENVILTARLARAADPSIRFVLLGGGSQRARLEQLAGGLANVSFLDPLPEADFPNILAASDLLLVNERKSVIDMSLPSKLTSYFRAGRPVIAAVPDGSTAAEIRRSQAGIVVAAEAPGELLNAIHQLAADPARASALGAAGSRYAHDVLCEAAVLANYERLFQTVIAAHQSAEIRQIARVQGAS
jgi:glycosyltransferase involved in cell wall biosynthesis